MAKARATRLMTTKYAVATAFISLAAALSVPQTAVAGPPFRTDDPVPADYQHGELYLFAVGTQAQGTNEGLAPGIEANYGIMPNGMLHAILPVATYNRTDGQTNWAMGTRKSA